MTGNPELGALIRRLREEKRRSDPTFSVRQFAEKIGISPTYLSKVELGKVDPPATDRLIAIAELLGADPDTVLIQANRIPPDVIEIVRRRPKVMVALLRAADGVTEAEVAATTQELQQRKHNT
jgi:HTH-type transcriptional regulator, competence development regulator